MSNRCCWHRGVVRLVATTIDAILVPALTIVFVMLTGVVEDAPDYADTWWILHVLLLAIAELPGAQRLHPVAHATDGWVSV
ncbi:MAG: hypothetical protein HC809_04645 [Gammaproteobacteria bacterium]|nr:hypothetical protein [Gammaproteobacteria bacterium]